MLPKMLPKMLTIELCPIISSEPSTNGSFSGWGAITVSNAVHLRQAPKAVERLLSVYLSVLHAKLAPTYESFQLVEELLFLLDSKSAFTASHSRRVAAAAREIAVACQLEELMIERVSVAALLHDVGKLATPNHILEKRSSLTQAERKCIQTHAIFTNVILAAFPVFDVIRDAAALHHEHLNGTGYPFGLSGDKLSIETRIITVADIFVALTEERPYRPALSITVALHKLNSLAQEGILDPDVVSHAMEAMLCWAPSASMWSPSRAQVDMALSPPSPRVLEPPTTSKK